MSALDQRVEYWRLGLYGRRFLNWSLEQVEAYRNSIGMNDEPIYGYNHGQIVVVINTSNGHEN